MTNTATPTLSVLTAAARFKATLDKLHSDYREGQARTTIALAQVHQQIGNLDSVLVHPAHILKCDSHLFEMRRLLQDRQASLTTDDAVNVVLYRVFSELQYAFTLNEHFSKDEWDRAMKGAVSEDIVF